MSGRPEVALGWWADGESLLGSTVDRIGDDDLPGASLLPGWSRHRLLAHLARNADALVNLLTWARTGVETPMYASAEARAAGINEAAALRPDALRQEFAHSVARLDAATRSLPEAAWAAEVRTAQGRTVTAAEVPWMRCREVWVHAVDLAGAVGFGDIPPDVCTALLEDVTTMWARRGETPDVTLVAADGARSWGDGAVTATGPGAALVGWVTGRAGTEGLVVAGPVPTLPAWL